MLKKMKASCRIILAALTIAAFTAHTVEVSIVNPNLTTVNAAETIEELNEQIREARDQISEIDEREGRVQKQKEENNIRILDILNQISESEQAIASLELDIEKLQQSIDESIEALAQLDIEIEELGELIGQRLRVAQRFNQRNPILDALSESENLVDFIRRFRALTHLSTSDAELLEELNLLIDRQQDILVTLQGEQAELSARKSELEAENIILAGRQAELESEQAALALEIQELEGERLSAEEKIRIAEENRAVLERVIVPEVTIPPPSRNNNNTPGPIVDGGGGFSLPLASGFVLCEWMCYPGHSGIDLSSSNRTAPILAAAPGVVTHSEFNAGGYGNFIIISHNINGQTFATLYAHLSVRSVSVGETVERGQQIGNMGATGFVIGSSGHLHFEIHPGGFNWRATAVNPRNHIHFPSSW